MYNLWFHPLAAYPGPLLARCSRLWYVYNLLQGRLPFEVHKAHQRYGKILRIAPDELSCIDSRAWKDVYGFRASKGEVPKDPAFYSMSTGGQDSIIWSPGDSHGQLRRLLSHGFSDKVMRQQETIIRGYVDTAMRKLRDNCEDGKTPIDMVSCYNVRPAND